MLHVGALSSKGSRCGDERRADEACIIGGRMSETDAIVFVVDDDASVRRSTERLLRAAGFDVRTFASAKEFKDQPPVDRPACLVLDVSLPGLSGLDLQRELAASGVRIPIVFITGRGTIPMSVRAMKDGAVEFLTKPVRSRDLLAAIETALERDRAAHRDRRAASALRDRYERLTAREREVLAFVIAGLHNKAIAAELAMTERTVKFHRAHVMTKMQAESIAELVRLAEQLGIAPRGVAAPVPKDR
jgi:FixJ family two-component response regulator